MSVTLSTLKAEIEVNMDQVRKGSKTAEEAMEAIIAKARTTEVSVEKMKSSMVKSFDEVGRAATRAGAVMSAGLTAPIVALGKSFLDTAGEMDSMTRGLTAIMGTASRAQAELVKLKEVAKLPGLGMAEAVQGSINLQATGMSADQARKALMAFGNALATVGKGKAQLDMVNYALTQMRSVGKVLGGDLRQLQNQLPQLKKTMMETFGTDTAEGINAMGIKSEEFIDRISAAFLKLPQVTGGIKNTMENLSDSFDRFKVSVGTAIGGIVAPMMDNLSKTFDRLAEAFKKLDPNMQKMILFGTAIVAAIGPALIIFGQLASAVSAISGLIDGTLLASLGSVLPIIAAVAGAAYLLYKAWEDNFGGIRDFAIGLWKDLQKFFGDIVAMVKTAVEENRADIIGVWEGIKVILIPIVESMKIAITLAWNTIKNVVKFAVDAIMTIVKVGAKIITGDWKGAFNSLLDFIRRTVSRIVSIVADGLIAVLKNVQAFGNYIAKAFGGEFKALEGTIGFLEGFNEQFTAMTDETTETIVQGTKKAKESVEALGKETVVTSQRMKGSLKDSVEPFKVEAPPIIALIDTLTKRLEDSKAKLVSVGHVGELAALKFRLFQGSLKGSRDALKQQAIALQSEIDKIVESTKAQEAYNKSMTDSAIKLAELKDLRTETLELIGLELSAFRKLTDEQQKAALKRAGEIGDVNQDKIKREERAQLNKLAWEEFKGLKLSTSELSVHTEYEKALLNLTRGRLAGTNSILQALILQAAKLKDIKIAEIAKEEKTKSLRESLLNDAFGYGEQLQRNLDTMDLQTEAQRLQYEFANGRFAKLDSSMKSYLLNLAQELDYELMIRDVLKEISDQKERQKKIYQDYMKDLSLQLSVLRSQSAEQALINQLIGQGMTEANARAAASFKKYVETVQEASERMKKFASDFSDMLLDSLTDRFDLFFQNIYQGFRKLLVQLAAEYLKSQFIQLLMRNLGGSGWIFGMPGGGGSQYSSPIGPGMGGGMAMGGSLRDGKAHLVGENGPEVFMPDTPGRIIPNHVFNQLTNAITSMSSRSSQIGFVSGHDLRPSQSSSSQTVTNETSSIVFAPQITVQGHQTEEFRRSMHTTVQEASRMMKEARNQW